jgi:hypothetical protein
MGCNISSYKKQCEYNISNNLYDTKRRESILIKDFENKTTNNTKEFIKNIEKYENFKKKAIELYSNYNKNSNEEYFSDECIKLKIFNFSNILIDEIEITENYIKSAYNTNNKIKFGKNKKISFGSNNLSDYIINDNSLSPIQFYIYYKENNRKFYILDNLSGTGTFVKINKGIILMPNMIISFLVDLIYFDVNKLSTGDIEIKLNFLYKKKNNQPNSNIIINSKDYSIFTIGRSKLCNYIYDEETVSKIQCTIIFKDKNWILYDGYYSISQNKNSTNGIWLLTKNGVLIENQMIFKSGNLKILSNIY